MKLFAYTAIINLAATAAFTLNVPKAPSTVILGSTPKKAKPDYEIFPTYESMDYVEAGETVRTYPMPPWAERVQMRFETNGRPLKGEANMWVGPLRKVHTLKFDNESGVEFPIETLLKFKKLAPVLRISTADNQNYPMKVGVFVPPPERAAELAKNTEKTFAEATADQKQIIQGSNTDGKYGMRCNWVIPQDVESIQLLGWSKDTGLKSFKVDIELLQGPNNIKQKYFLQCGGGSQPYHAVFQTPGPGWVVRIRNKKFVEDGKVQIAVVPYEKTDIESGKRSVSWGN
jgi:hypothetical protein